MKMKLNLRTGFFVLLSIFLTACSQEALIDEPANESGEMKLSLQMSVPAWTDVSTRAGVSTADIGISTGSMQLLCFDSHGFYLGMGTQVTVNPSDDFNGKLEAKVPSNTSRIHFIANANLSDNGEWIGMYENTLITKLTANDGDKMVYWGYVKKSSSAEMKSFLESGRNTVYMLRNEAAVTVVNNDATINSISLTVCNDANKGSLVPFNQNDLTDPFGYDSEGADATYIPSDAAIRTVPTSVGSDTEQFIFESNNSLEQPVRVILKATYTNGTTRYHKIQLIDSKYQFYKIRRNHKYQINIKQLSPNVGYTDFTQALNGNPSNNALINVDDIISSITDYAKRTLTITDANKVATETSIIYNEAGTKTVYFTYTGDDEMTVDDFKATWIENDGISPKDGLTLTYENGFGSISFDITSVSSEMQKGKIHLLDTKHGLSRNVKVYAVSPFDFNGNLVPRRSPSYVLTATKPVNVYDTGYSIKAIYSAIYSSNSITFYFTYNKDGVFDQTVKASDFTIERVSYEDQEYAFSISESISQGTYYGDKYWSFTVSTSGNISSSTSQLYATKFRVSINGLSIDFTAVLHNSSTTFSQSYPMYRTYVDSEEKKETPPMLTFTIPENYPEDLMPVTVRIATNDFNPTDPTLDVVVDDTKTITDKDWDFWYEYKAETYGTHTLILTPSRTSSTGNELWLYSDNFNAQKITFSY